VDTACRPQGPGVSIGLAVCSARTTISSDPQNTPSQTRNPAQTQTASHHAPLGPDHLIALAEGQKRSRKIRRAVSVANAHACLLGICGAVTLLFAIFGDYVALVLGIAFCFLAWNEIRGGKQLSRFDPQGAMRLAFNQLGFGTVIVLYAGWSLWSSAHAAPSAESAEIQQLLAQLQLGNSIAELTRTISFAVYGLIAAFGILEPGLLALYYLSRGRMARQLLETTPPWVIEAMKTLS